MGEGREALARIARWWGNDDVGIVADATRRAVGKQTISGDEVTTAAKRKALKTMPRVRDEGSRPIFIKVLDVDVKLCRRTATYSDICVFAGIVERV